MLLERLARREETGGTQSDGKADSSTPDKGSVRILPPSNENHMKQGKPPMLGSTKARPGAYDLATTQIQAALTGFEKACPSN